jgi:hypothetical protein
MGEGGGGGGGGAEVTGSCQLHSPLGFGPYLSISNSLIIHEQISELTHPNSSHD